MGRVGQVCLLLESQLTVPWPSRALARATLVEFFQGGPDCPAQPMAVV